MNPSETLGEADLPDAAGPFTLSVTQAAAILKLTPTNLLDLTAAGVVPALIVPVHMTNARPPLRFAPGLLADVAELLESRRNDEEAADILKVSRTLRTYLQDRPPTEDYDLAMRSGYPVLSQDRKGELFAHVRLEVVTEVVNRAEGFLFNSKVRAALERLGAIQLKSLHPIGDRKQRWHVWWRLPASFWAVGHPDGIGFTVENTTALTPLAGER